MVWCGGDDRGAWISKHRGVVSGGGAAVPAANKPEVASPHVMRVVEIGPRVAFDDSDGFDVISIQKDGSNAGAVGCGILFD